MHPDDEPQPLVEVFYCLFHFLADSNQCAEAIPTVYVV